jgi:uncharacterized protein YdiU (UPF0061 family)
MTNPLTNQNSDTVWNMHDLINDLIDELRMTRGNFVSEIAQGLDNYKQSGYILNVLEYYDTLVLEELQNYMKKYIKSLFEIIQKRRLAYVDKVRRHHALLESHKKQDGDNMVDFSRDQDDTANLADGIGVIGRGIEKIEQMIQKKKLVTSQRKREESLHWWAMLSTFIVVFTLAYIIGGAYIHNL